MLFGNSAGIEIDGPNSSLTLYVGGTFELKNSATLQYDASLRDVSLDDQGVRFVIDRWYED